MSIIPAAFRGYVVEHFPDRVERGVRALTAADLPPGEVTIRVTWSSVNYKDGLAATFDGKVARISPLVPGIDLAGVVVASDDDAFRLGTGCRQRLRAGRVLPQRLRGSPPPADWSCRSRDHRPRGDGARHGRFTAGLSVGRKGLDSNPATGRCRTGAAGD
jgi:hypothetical protein